jgi:hypothetical protein
LGARNIDAMQQAAFRARNSNAMQQAALGARNIDAMQQAALGARNIDAMQQAALGACTIYKYFHAAEQHFAWRPKVEACSLECNKHLKGHMLHF